MKYLYSALGFLLIPVMAFAQEEEPAAQAAVDGYCMLNGQRVPCSEAWAAIAPYLAVLIPLMIIFALIMIIATWRIYTKAGKPGWASIVPIYNCIVLLEIVNRPVWWIILFLVPFANIIVQIIVYHRLARSFGKGTGYTLGLIFLPFIFFPMLGFGKSVYTRLQD